MGSENERFRKVPREDGSHGSLSFARVSLFQIGSGWRAPVSVGERPGFGSLGGLFAVRLAGGFVFPLSCFRLRSMMTVLL